MIFPKKFIALIILYCTSSIHASGDETINCSNLWVLNQKVLKIIKHENEKSINYTATLEDGTILSTTKTDTETWATLHLTSTSYDERGTGRWDTRGVDSEYYSILENGFEKERSKQ